MEEAQIDDGPEEALLALRSTVYPGVTKLVCERLQASRRTFSWPFARKELQRAKR